MMIDSIDSYKAFLALKRFLINSGRNYDYDLVTRAYEFAADLHDEQYRKSGEEYICHPIAVAQICANLGYGTDCICAAILHDVVEDCPDKTSQKEILRLFGENIASIVSGLTKLKGVKFMTKEEEDVVNIRKMFTAMSEEFGVILVKLCDRLHNMRTLGALPPDKQKRIALETMHIFAPIADKLGIKKIKAELDDLSLRYLDPFAYEQIEKYINQRFGESRETIESCQDRIKARLNTEKITFIEEGRVKSVASIYQKTIQKACTLEEIFDIYAIRYIVGDLKGVYHVLGIVHELFPHMQGRYKDYISTPKQNGYQSVHTTVTSGSVPIEVQIRTKDMHEVAQYGVAAHTGYKYNLDESIAWLRELIEANNDINMDRDEIVANLKESFYSDEIYVYTPKGDIKPLRRGATVIDFAYAIHSAVGNRMTGAKVNGVIVPIEYVLDNNQKVQILTSNSSKGPSRDWLDIARTSNARNKIRQWFKQEKRAENILIGRDEVKKILRELARKPLTEEKRDEILNNISKRAGYAALDDFYNAIGYGGESVAKLYIKIRDELDRAEKENLIFDIEQVEMEEPPGYSDGTEVIIDGVDNCSIKLAKCCNPVRGDRIYGFVTKGHGLSIHRDDCRNFIVLRNQEGNEERVFTAFWNESQKSIKNNDGFVSKLKISAVDDKDLMRRIVETVHDMRVPMHSISKAPVKKSSGDNVVIDLLISARDVEHVNYIISRLKNMKNVKDANRDSSARPA